MKSLNSLLFVALAFLASSFITIPPTENLPEGAPSYFYPADELKKILSNADGIRFYNSHFSEIGETLMAVATIKEADKKDAKYYVFENVMDGRTIINPIGKQDARQGCANLPDENRFAVTFSPEQIAGLLGEDMATGIGLAYSTNGDGSRSLTAFASTIKGREIIVVGSAIPNRNPCPTYCGSSPQQNYLCEME